MRNLAIQLITLFAISSFLTSCATTGLQKHDVYGSFRDTALTKDGMVWEGDSVKIDELGYKHRRFTDELCEGDGCWLDQKPYKEYSGSYTLKGNKIIFDKSYIQPNTRYVVRAKRGMLLLTYKQYIRYKSSLKLPNYALTNIEVKWDK